MGLVQKITARRDNQKKQEKKNTPARLLKYFHASEGSDDFPLTLALTSLDSVNQNAANPEDYLLCLLEDCIFTSLYVTFYEEILSAIRDNPKLINSLVKRFAADRDERENVISAQTNKHLSFIDKGSCEGCSACDNHTDVAELRSFWIKKDIAFFENLYVGMQTIQYSMEHLLYEVIQNNTDILGDLSPSNILRYRQEIFNYTAKFI